VVPRYKERWISLKVSRKVAEVVRVAASTMGISVSEFARQAILERLERMNVMGSEVKAALTKGAGAELIEAGVGLRGGSHERQR
jgi:uncharacterized protein (DUF1778 family)